MEVLAFVLAACLVAPARAPDGDEAEGKLVPLPAEIPAPTDNPTTPEKVALGKQLFFDPRLSGDNTRSCASCHIPQKAFGDGLPLGKGHGDKALSRNVPTLLDAALHSSYLWDGRATSLEEQALIPLRSPDEMAQDLDALEEELNAVPGYARQFAAVFGTRVDRTGIARALAAFQRTLVTRDSPFDRYLRGEEDAISDDAKEGLRLFQGEAGCIRCHSGALLADGEYHRLGVGGTDRGRGAVTGRTEDDYRYRTPSLRNVARTGPYMHDGSMRGLTDVVSFYYRTAPRSTSGGLPLDIEPLTGRSFSEVALIVAFLECLTGETPDIEPPELPGNSAPGSSAQSTFRVELPRHRHAADLLPRSPFGINMALDPGDPDVEARLAAMQEIGIKWGRQDFTWKRIERTQGVYDFAPYERLLEDCRRRGILLFGNLAYAPDFHDPRTPDGAEAYARFARAAASALAGKVDDWQIWNEPNGGFWKGTPEEYARLLAAAGKAIHEANPRARVLGLNMAFCDVIWAERILKLVPYDSFDIACFHPYRPPCAPEEKFDWWELDHYVKRWHAKDLAPDYPLVRMSFLEQTGELVKVMEEFGKPKPIWITEICWNTHIHPYGTSELRQADLAVRFHALALASGRIEKVFWWTLKDIGDRQFDQADMVGLARADLRPKYAYYAYGIMARMLEGKRTIRVDAAGPDAHAIVFGEEGSAEETILAWATKPYAYVRVENEKGLVITDVYGTRREVPMHPVRTRRLSIPLGESPVYITGPKGMKATVRPDPGW